ncbi:MAG: hypothetical protein WED33_04050 [Bacteroidia bacterium]
MTETLLNTFEDQLKTMVSSGQIRYKQMLNVIGSVPADTPLDSLTAEQVALVNIKLSAPEEDDCEFCSG